MIARIRDYLYRLRRTVSVGRNMARPGVPLEDFSKRLASTVATAEYTVGIARAVAEAMQPILEIQSAEELRAEAQCQAPGVLVKGGEQS